MRIFAGHAGLVFTFVLLCTSAMYAAEKREIPAPPDVAEPPEDALVLANGLATKVLKKGTGSEKPGPTDTVVVNYTGWTTDGKMFDSSIVRGAPVRLPLDKVIEGWTLGLQMMVPGEMRRLWIPENLAYQGSAGKPAGLLVFDVELVRIYEPPKAPTDVAAPPAGAEVTKSGLASMVLQEGDGTRKPSRFSTVTVHYTGWTTDGKMFDSSVERGRPSTFGLDQVIRGWTEGLQLMVEGEKRRFWIPEKLAYRGQKGAPQGMLVFDVELISFTTSP